ncbi:MAG TPA: 4-aminobutyrate--2-oxoglutarate transaminase [Actinomycetota bacterium]|nr:4-aminobutyrate--2-oxoglutarate transaminase [Actinomycetota bacterium]
MDTGGVGLPQERRLVTEIPGPGSRALIERRGAAVPRAVWSTVPIFVRAASGAIVEDVDGNRLIDLGAGLAVLNAGNAPPEVVDAVREQAERYTHTCFHVTMNEPYVALAERLNGLAPGDHDKRTFLVSSGAEAVENAVKIARYTTGRDAVVTFDHAFHGRTLMAMSLTAKVMPYKHGFGPYAPEVYRLPFAYPYRCPMGAPPEECGPACAEHAIGEMERHIGPEQIACVVLEPVQGEGGFVVPGAGFVARIAEFCRAHGILLVADEVQTGFGRTGRWFGIEHEGVAPDLVTMAKALGGGLPIGAVTGRADLMDAVHVGGLGGTFGGNPLACAAAMAVIEAIERQGLVERAGRLGEAMLGRLGELQGSVEAVGDVRGRGAMAAIELVADRRTKEPDRDATQRVVEEAYRQGVILLKAGTYDNVIRLLPPLTIEDHLLDEGLGILEKSLAAAVGL